MGLATAQSVVRVGRVAALIVTTTLCLGGTLGFSPPVPPKALRHVAAKGVTSQPRGLSSRRRLARATSQRTLALFSTTTTTTAPALAANVVGVGSASPTTVLTNDDVAEFVDTSDEWISQRTGISSRRVLNPGESIAHLATEAGVNALEAAGISADAVDLVILATSSPEDLFGDACAVARDVGAVNAAAFDLTAACSGFLFALVTAAQFLHAGTYTTILVVGADALSRWVDWDDRNSCILFGDGAGAVVVKRPTASEQADDNPRHAGGGILGFAMHSNGGDQRHLTLPYAGEERELGTTTKAVSVTRGAYEPVTMNGREVYKFATREVPRVIEEALRKADKTVDDVDWLVLHQANSRIMETVADRLGLPREKIVANLDEHGNTSAASIPLALDAAVKSGKIKPGHLIAFSGFGAGLSWSAAIVRWDGK